MDLRGLYSYIYTRGEWAFLVDEIRYGGVAVAPSDGSDEIHQTPLVKKPLPLRSR